MSTWWPLSGPAVREKLSEPHRLAAVGVVIIILLGIAFYFGWMTLWRSSPAKDVSEGESVANIETTSGSVSVRLRGNVSWNKGRQGMKLCEGDLIQTGSSGAVQLRFLDGALVSVPSNAMLAIRHVEDRAGKGPRPLSLSSGPVSLAAEKPPQTPAPVDKPSSETPTKVAEPVRQAKTETPKPIVRPEPTLELNQVVPFGQSLQLVGRVDPGNRLSVNGETVTVLSDGSFKHFTKPFTTGGTVQLVLKTTDLAGRVRTLTRSVTIN